MILYTIGYGYWPPARRIDSLVAALTLAAVKLLIDTRHSPCASQLDASTSYGPRDWNLQAGDAGIVRRLEHEGIDYRWLVELGNPQKNDLGMTVLRRHLESRGEHWPVNRGLVLLRQILEASGPCALLCACADYRKCHRTLIAKALQQRYPELALEIAHLPLVGR